MGLEKRLRLRAEKWGTCVRPCKQRRCVFYKHRCAGICIAVIQGPTLIHFLSLTQATKVVVTKVVVELGTLRPFYSSH